MRIPMDRQICLPYQRRVLNGVICIADHLKRPQIVFVLTANPIRSFILTVFYCCILIFIEIIRMAH